MKKHKEKRQGGRISTYDTGLKISIARQYLSGQWSYLELGEEHGLRGPTVRHFVKWYLDTYSEVEQESAVSAPTPASTELAELRKQLEMARLKVEAYETMMSIAQKELDIDIVKKYGTKQSGK